MGGYWLSQVCLLTNCCLNSGSAFIDRLEICWRGHYDWIRPNMNLRNLINSTVACLLLASPGFAQCAGDSLLSDMSVQELSRLHSVADQKYATGRFWQAEKNGARSVLFGTFHVSDPEIAYIPDELRKRIETARLLMVEITTEEEALMTARLSSPPSLIRNQDGRRLSEKFNDEDWEKITQAFAVLGLTPPVIDQMEPWYLSLVLSVPRCMIVAEMSGKLILDRMIEDLAEEHFVPVEGLEPYQEILDVLREDPYDVAADYLLLAAENAHLGEEMIVTSKELYKRGEILAIWELGAMMSENIMGEDAKQMMDEAYDALITRRNDNWKDTLLPALEQGNVVVAVGALHLGGRSGLLPMLEAEGFTLRALSE